jgi:integrase
MARPRTPIASYGEISVVEVEPRKWRARTRYRFEDGRLRQVERFAPTKAAARTKLVTALTELEAPSAAPVTSATKLRILGERYIEQKATGNVTARTVDTYQQTLDRVIAPQGGGGVGALSVREASTERLHRFLSEVTAERGPGAAKTARSVLSGMMSYAVRLGAAKINPVREVGAITQKPEGAVAITSGTMPALLGKVRGHEGMIELDLPDLVEFLAGTGARISEALALQWDHVDLKSAAVEITRNAVRVKGKGLILQDHTKTQASMRVIAVPQHVVTMLRARKLAQRPNDLGLVFPTVLGNLRDPNNTARDWRLYRDDVGAADTSFHSFRKYVATALDLGGLTAREIAEYLGHARPSMTTDVYMSRKVGGDKAATALDVALG